MDSVYYLIVQIFKKKKCKKWVYYMKKYSYLKTFVFIFLWLI